MVQKAVGVDAAIDTLKAIPSDGDGVWGGKYLIICALSYNSPYKPPYT